MLPIRFEIRSLGIHARPAYLYQYDWDENAFQGDRNGLPETQGPGETTFVFGGGNTHGTQLLTVVFSLSNQLVPLAFILWVD
jgi:hypothetical protein